MESLAINEYSLDELLSRVTPENIQEETSFEKPVGKEIIQE